VFSRTYEIQGRSRILPLFKVVPGLENERNKFQDFKGPVETLINATVPIWGGLSRVFKDLFIQHLASEALLIV